MSTVLRRARTIPLYAVATALFVALSPLTGLVAVVTDLVRPRRFALTRTWAFVGTYLIAEMVGVTVLGALWASTGFGRARARLRRGTYRVQTGWVTFLWAAASRVLGLRWQVRGAEDVRPGPVVLMVRHTSLVDTVVPTAFVTHQLGITLRFVLKRELLGDPCIDVAGHWVPNVFIDRAAADSTESLAAIEGLARGLGPTEGALIYPEGTLFSAKKLARALAKLEQGDPALHERARKLRHTLPPRPRGTLALLAGAPQADVVLCAHDGLGGLGKVADLLSGAMVGRTVFVEFRRFARATVPDDAEAQATWLFDRWLELDAWVAAKRGGPDGAPAEPDATPRESAP